MSEHAVHADGKATSIIKGLNFTDCLVRSHPEVSRVFLSQLKSLNKGDMGLRHGSAVFVHTWDTKSSKNTQIL